MRQLEELNLVDDFLANSLTSHKIYGEPAARCILECILHRKLGKITVIPQRFLQGEDTDRHGIRMDVYLDEEDGELFDMEPDNNSNKDDISSLPKRAHTYDPFGCDRMVYTVKNCCIEMPELLYEDGARTIFLYTKGTEGNPPKDLRQLLRYMEHSSIENAETEVLQKLHEMVTAVKKDGKVGLAYMKSFEIEARLRKEGLAEGITSGLTKGILDLLGDLGEIPSPLREEITAQRDESTLRTWLKYAAKAENMEDFMERISG